jgi:hypothetical protein
LEDCPKTIVRIPVRGREKSGKAPGKLRAGNKYTVQTSYQRSRKNSLLVKRNMQENSCLRTGVLTNSKGFCENSGLGKEISGKTSGLIRKTYS